MKIRKILCVAAALLCIVSTADATPQFMSLLFRDNKVIVQQGWQYHGFKTTTHYGVDYIKGSFNSDPSTWQPFDVLASFSGEAIRGYETGWGNYVWVKTTINGEIFNAIYAHLADNTSPIPSDKWVSISRGDYIGRAGDTGLNSGGLIHLHFESSKGAGCIGKTCSSRFDPYGIYNTAHYYPENPSYKGCGVDYAFTSCPPSFPLTATSHPNGTMVREVATQAAWYLENGLRRGITSEQTIIGMGRDPKEVIAVSSKEISCWPRGNDLPLVPDTSFGASWNGSKAGTLVRQIGTNPVYQVGDDCFLHWLNITEAEFYSFGYNSSIIRDVPSVWNIGNPIVKEDFQRCNKVVISVDNFTSTGTGKYVAVRIGPAGGVGGGFEGVPAFVFGSPADMPSDYDYVSEGGRQFNVREQFSDILISSDGMLRNQRLYEVELRKIKRAMLIAGSDPASALNLQSIDFLRWVC